MSRLVIHPAAAGPLQAACSGCMQPSWGMQKASLGMAKAFLGMERAAARHWIPSRNFLPFQLSPQRCPVDTSRQAVHSLLQTFDAIAPGWLGHCSLQQMPASDCLGTAEWRLICSAVLLDLKGSNACHLGQAGKRGTAAECFVGVQLAVELDWPFHS